MPRSGSGCNQAFRLRKSGYSFLGVLSASFFMGISGVLYFIADLIDGFSLIHHISIAAVYLILLLVYVFSDGPLGRYLLMIPYHMCFSATSLILSGLQACSWWRRTWRHGAPRTRTSCRRSSWPASSASWPCRWPRTWPAWRFGAPACRPSPQP